MSLDGTKETIVGFFQEVYQSLESAIPLEYRILLDLGIYVLFIAVYAFIIWKFYRFLARRDILRLNLAQYSKSDHPVLNKFLGTVLYILEHVIILPIVVFIWFVFLALFILMLSKEQPVYQVVFVAAALIGSTRIISYYSEDLSRDLSKMFPFTLLAIFLLNPDYFTLDELFLRLGEVQSIFQHIFMYLAFIFVLEIILRALYSLYEFIKDNNGYSEGGGEKKD